MPSSHPDLFDLCFQRQEKQVAREVLGDGAGGMGHDPPLLSSACVGTTVSVRILQRNNR